MMTNYPRITIVTPSYSQAAYVEATMRSVLDQGYPNLEYIVVDGGSTDGAVDIIKRYADRLAWWVSEPDGGQYDAINKGFARSTGEIMAWLNSDDIYFPWTLSSVAHFFTTYPSIRWISGEVCDLNKEGQVFGTGVMGSGTSRDLILRGCYRDGLAGFLPQEGMFWRRNLWEESGSALDTDFKLAADFELWCRFAKFASPVAAKCLLAGFRKHPLEQRSRRFRQQYEDEVDTISTTLKKPPLIWQKVRRIKLLSRAYSLLFVYGGSSCLEYDMVRSQWIHRERSHGRLYRVVVVRRKR